MAQGQSTPVSLKRVYEWSSRVGGMTNYGEGVVEMSSSVCTESEFMRRRHEMGTRVSTSSSKLKRRRVASTASPGDLHSRTASRSLRVRHDDWDGGEVYSKFFSSARLRTRSDIMMGGDIFNNGASWESEDSPASGNSRESPKCSCDAATYGKSAGSFCARCSGSNKLSSFCPSTTSSTSASALSHCLPVVESAGLTSSKAISSTSSYSRICTPSFPTQDYSQHYMRQNFGGVATEEPENLGSFITSVKNPREGSMGFGGNGYHDDGDIPDLRSTECPMDTDLDEEENSRDVSGKCSQEQSDNMSDLPGDMFSLIRRLPSLPTSRQHLPPLLPAVNPNLSKKPTLVLDLDETLVHSSIEPFHGADFVFSVNCNERMFQVYTKKRPFVDKFLSEVAKRFEVVVFTASQEIYASRILDLLDPTGNIISHKLYRESCYLVEGNYLKELSCLGRDLRRTVIVDNSPAAFGYQLDNGIPIESWFDDESDSELLALLPFLDKLSSCEDVCPLLRDKYKLRSQVGL